MKATGIVRRIDELGRVVIPKEIRRTLRIREGDPLEIFTDRDGEVILKKYSPISAPGKPGLRIRFFAARQDGRLEIEDDLDGGTVERPMLPDGFADCGGFIRTVNGIGPDAGGNFSIIGGSGVEVRDFPDEHRIEIDFTKGLSDKACIV